ncbi:hypothetical protein [Streptomyces sp. NRRL S-87]|uniref:hypothetical protein n=1 Tax=Streptomyces sp. NRRL S-87 TaxID=1463920 RepID=UPI0004C079E3|nr:hypothetical protein [Streptomyces sp. NRRL S-87]
MGRHSLPDPRTDRDGAPRGRSARRRAVVIGTALALAGGAVAVAVAAAQGALPFSRDACADRPVRLRVVASPDIAPVVREAADRARARHLTSDGRCLAVTVAARASRDVAVELGAGHRARTAGSTRW